MVYVDFAKNFHIADLKEEMAIRLISANWAQETFLFLLSKHGVRRVHEKYSSHRFERGYGS